MIIFHFFGVPISVTLSWSKPLAGHFVRRRKYFGILTLPDQLTFWSAAQCLDNDDINDFLSVANRKVSLQFELDMDYGLLILES